MARARPALAAASIAAVLAGGCVIHGRYHAASYVGNGALVAAGALVLADHQAGCVASPNGECPASDVPVHTSDLIGGSLLVAGAVGIVLAALDRGAPADARPAPPTPLPAGPAPAAGAPDLAPVREQARAEADLGHCAAVVALGERVFQLAPSFHALVFVRDPVIAPCLTAPR
jgi:hypothetical protein